MPSVWQESFRGQGAGGAEGVLCESVRRMEEGAVTLALEGAGSRKSLPALQAMASPRTLTGGDQLPVR